MFASDMTQTLNSFLLDVNMMDIKACLIKYNYIMNANIRFQESQ